MSSNAPAVRDAQPNMLLVALGIVLIGAALVNWFVVGRPPVTKVTETVGQTQVTEEAGSSSVVEEADATTEVQGAQTSERQRVSTITDPGTKTVTTETGPKTTTTGPKTTTTITRASTADRRSEALTIALLGLGTVALLAGAFYPRISSITLPGGAGVALSAVTDIGAELEARLKSAEDVLAKVATVGGTNSEAVRRLEAQVDSLKQAVRLLLELGAGRPSN